MSRTFFPFVIAVLFLIQFEGCTVFGGVIGGVIDLTQPPDVRPLSSFTRYGIGDTIRVKSMKDSTIKGTFSGLYEYNDSEYTALYSSALTRLNTGVGRQTPVGDTRFPAIGEPLNITIRRGRDTLQQHGNFYGFDKNSLGIISSPPPYALLLTEFPEIRGIRNVEGRSFDRNAMENAMTRGEIPFRTAVRLKTNGSTVMIPGEQVRFGYIYHSKSHWLSGLLIGLAIDMAVFAITLSGNHMSLSVG